jgi:ribosomal protein S18 acetylase RimI-like enzyme
MARGFTIASLATADQTLAALTEIIIETVASGGSVSFTHPLAPETAREFWATSLAAADRGERVVLGAWTEAGELASTVTLDLTMPQNQPHRAEIAKLMTRVAHRGHGAARALMQEAERLAAAAGRTLLVLDTAVEDGASGLYERLGYEYAGTIPDYALKPRGGLTGTMIYYKRISAGP